LKKFVKFFYPVIQPQIQDYLLNKDFTLTSGQTGSDESSKISPKNFPRYLTLKYAPKYYITDLIKPLNAGPVKPEVMTH
jgi:hypothetical protein